MSKSRNKGNGQVILSDVRLSYAHIFEPKAIGLSTDVKYSTAILIDKEDTQTLAVIEKAIEEAMEKGRTSKWGGKLPKNLKTPLRDGDEEREDEVYEGHMFFNASSFTKPGVLNERKQPATEDEVYSGCYAFASLNFYPFDVNGNRGIAVGLNNIMKQRDGERLSGGPSAEDDFAEIEAEELDYDDLI